MFAFLFSFLACYPCSDGESCDEETESHAQVNISEEHQSTNEIDLCSPFCICSCCHHQLTRTADFHLQFFFPTYVVENVAYLSCFIDTISPSIWQPPRL
jgi:hypothetical protein